MASESASSTRMSPRRRSAFAVCLLGVVVATTAIIDTGARNKGLALWMDREREARVRDERRVFTHKGFYDSSMDQMLLDELPNADYSRGSVCLIGSSNIMSSTRLWELPDEQRALIHNYGLPGTCHALHFHLLRFLIEQQQLLRAGGDKTLVIFGITYSNIHCTDGYLLNRSGLYTFDKAEGIRAAPVHPLKRWLITEKSRIPGFLFACREFAVAGAAKLAGLPLGSRRVHDRDDLNKFWREYVGVDWEQSLQTQIAVFERTLEYLKARHVRIAVILLPCPSWDGELPFRAHYNPEVARVCSASGVPLHDLSRMLDDEEFGDGSHVNLYGMDRLNSAILDIAMPHLRALEAAK